MVDARLDALMTTLTKTHAPGWLHRVPSGAERLSFLAMGLAKQGVLVLTTEIPSNYRAQQAELINDWVSTYGNFYRALSEALFPSMKHITAVYADNEYPPVVVLEGHCIPVIEAFANLVVPYVATHQQAKVANMAELQGIMNFVLEDLEGLDVAPLTYRDLVNSGVRLLSHLLELPLNQHSLTPFSRQHYQDLAPISPEPPPNMPETPKPVTERLAPPPDMPPTVPETPKPAPTAPPVSQSTPPLFSSSIPIFFENTGKDGKPKRKPPVMDLPQKDPE